MRNLITFIFPIFAIACSGIWGNKNYTFTEDIAPLLHKNCAPCHHKGGVGPFSLVTYQDARKKGKTMVRVTGNRTMPPWPADPAYSHFKDEKYLTQEQIDIIKDWYEGGMKEGPANKMPVFKIPDYKSSIGKPDLVLYLDSVQLYPDMRDRFFIYKIPGKMAHDTFVRAVEFVAGSPDLVHHFNGHLLMYGTGENSHLYEKPFKTEITQGEYDADFLKLNLLNDDGSKPYRIHSAVNYLPGVFGTEYPAGIGTFRLSKAFAFVGNDMHFGPSDRKTIDRSRINVFFTATPPSRETGEIMLGTNGVSKIEPPLRIPPNKVTAHVTKFTIDKDISILTINPHLHQLGKTFIAYAVKPNGDTIPLIRILKWDFRWQYFYTFTHMVPVPKGSTIIAVATFDNTRSNPENPFDPPQWIGERLEYGGASMRASDEMFQFIITYTLYQPGDEKISLETK